MSGTCVRLANIRKGYSLPVKYKLTEKNMFLAVWGRTRAGAAYRSALASVFRDWYQWFVKYYLGESSENND